MLRNGNIKKLYNIDKLIFEGEYFNGRRFNGKGYDNKNNVKYELTNGKGIISEYNNYGNLYLKVNI